jgi:CheY-like chemotaxis protein
LPIKKIKELKTVSKKLLLADDSVTIQKVVNLTFADEGIEVLTASDGNTALQMLLAHKPDIVIADVNMPGPNGYQICERIKTDEKLKNIPVILLVGSFEPFDEEEAKRVGADDFLTKPFQSIRHLMSKVSSLLEARASAPVEETGTREFDYRGLETEEYSIAEIEDVTIHEEPMISYTGEVTYEEKTEKDLAKTQPLSLEDIKEIKTDDILEIPHEEVSQATAVSEEQEQKVEHHIEEVHVELISSEKKEDAEGKSSLEQETTVSAVSEQETLVKDWAVFGEPKQGFPDKQVAEIPDEQVKESREKFEKEKSGEKIEARLEQEIPTESGTREVASVEQSPEFRIEQTVESVLEQSSEHAIAEQPAEPVAEKVTGIVSEKTGLVLEQAELTGDAISAEPAIKSDFDETTKETIFVVETSETVQNVAQDPIQEVAQTQQAQETIQELEVAHEPGKEVAKEPGELVARQQILETEQIETSEEKAFEENIPQPESISLLEVGEDEILELPPTDLPVGYIHHEVLSQELFHDQIAHKESDDKKVVSMQEPTLATSEKQEHVFSLPPEIIEEIAQKVARKIVELLSEKAIREIAWEVVPQQAELIIRKMIEEKSKK